TVRRARLFWGASMGAILFYTLSAFDLLPWLPLYLPRPDLWSWAAEPGEPSMRWYGFLVHGLIGALVGMALALPVRRPPWRLVPAFGAIAWLLLALHDRSW